MKIVSSFLYVISTFIYLNLATTHVLWSGFGQLTFMLFICVLCVFVLSNKPNTYREELFLKYCAYMTLGRALYMLYCVFIDNDGWVIYHTDVFQFIVGVTFAILVLYVAIKSQIK